VRQNNYRQIAMLPDVNGLFTTGCGLDADIYAEVIKNTAKILKYSEGELK
jgi:peroxiredoxin